MSKPQFVFLGMDTCGHCVNFKNKPTPETSVWAQLVSDKELQGLVDFVFIKHGFVKDEAGNTQRHQLPAEYAHVKYGPFFQLQPGNYPQNSMHVEMTRVPRNLASIKEWIKNTLKARPELSGKKTRTKITSTTVATPAQRSNVAQKSAARPVPDEVKIQIDRRKAEVERARAKVARTYNVQKPVQNGAVNIPKATETISAPSRKFIPRNSRK